MKIGVFCLYCGEDDRNGQLLIPDEYEEHDWEKEELVELIQSRIINSATESEEVQTEEEDKELDSIRPVATVSNSALFNREFFSMAHVQHLHGVCNGRQFEEVSPGDMYLIINLQHCPRNLKVRQGERSRVCHLIYVLGEMLPDNQRAECRQQMLDCLDIKYSYYNKKYLNPVGGNPSKNDEEFVERLDNLKEKYRKLEKAA